VAAVSDALHAQFADARPQERAGVSRTIHVGQVSFSSHLAADRTSIAYVETVSATTKLPHDAGELSYSISLKVEPLPRPGRPTDKSPNLRPIIVTAAAAAAVVMADQVANAYAPGGTIRGTRIPDLLVEGSR
jgi:hypothetical protein